MTSSSDAEGTATKAHSRTWGWATISISNSKD